MELTSIAFESSEMNYGKLTNEMMLRSTSFYWQVTSFMKIDLREILSTKLWHS